MTSEDGLKIKKTEIDALIRTDTIDFYQHLEFYKQNVKKKLSKTQK